MWGIAITLGSTGMALFYYAALLLEPDQSIQREIELCVFILIVVSLLYGNLVHQSCRLAFWRRLGAHRLLTRDQLESIYDRDAPKICVLIPSYREERHVLHQTILSAALAEYPERRVIVLIDDPPRGSAAEIDALEASRRLVTTINGLLAGQAHRIKIALSVLAEERRAGRIDARGELYGVADLYEEAAAWLDAQARQFESGPSAFAHTDRVFVDRIFVAPALAHRQRADRLRGGEPDAVAIRRHQRRLATLFQVEVGSFERKRYENLSHASNKAMNLNSYIGLLGGSWRSTESHGGVLRLEACEPSAATLATPAADFILTLDADSLILTDYMLKLASIMAADPRLAIVQTPYSAVPGPSSKVERIAGATTDIQYNLHQGLTRFGATYWVGANALVRLRALRDIRTTRKERGHEIPVFIRDRTVIEDTGATIDLIRAGWELYNYPERLSFSATPADFGALIIQRRRWANGGLLVMPDLVRHHRDQRWTVRRAGEFLMRSYYLGMPTLVSLGLLALLFYPFSDSLTIAWLPITAAPYYYLYGRDLKHCGYRWSDLLRAYSLNYILLPVNLAGVLSSIRQACTGRKAAFGRTPKIEGRTAMPFVHVLAQWSILGYTVLECSVDAASAHYVRAAFSLVNGGFLLYGLIAFVGVRASWQDFVAAIGISWPALWRRAAGALEAYARAWCLAGHEGVTGTVPAWLVPAARASKSAPVAYSAPEATGD